LDQRAEVLRLGQLVLALVQNERTVSEQILPIMCHAQRQTWRRLDTKTTLARNKIEKHDLVWAEAEAVRLKKRKRRLITVGMRPEEKAYLDIRAKLNLELNQWATDEENERVRMDRLDTQWKCLKRDKSNSIEALDVVQRCLKEYLDGKEGSGGGGGGGGGGDNSTTSTKGGSNNGTETAQSTSRTARSRRTQKTTARSRKSSKGGSSKGGRSSKGGKYDLEPGEPVWVKHMLLQFDKCIATLRTKRETSLLVEALDCYGDFQASRDGLDVHGGGNNGGNNGGGNTGPPHVHVLLQISPNLQRRKDACKSWLDCADALFNTVDVDRHWRDFVLPHANPTLNYLHTLKQLGLWGALKCGVVLSKCR
jgi:hypothetical protein